MEDPARRLGWSAPLLLLYPYTDFLVDPIDQVAPVALAYVAWIALDVILVVMALGMAGLWRAAAGFTVAAVAIDLGFVWLWERYDPERWSTQKGFWIVTAVLYVAIVAVIAAIMWRRTGNPWSLRRERLRREPLQLFGLILPLVGALLVAYAADLIGWGLRCDDAVYGCLWESYEGLAPGEALVGERAWVPLISTGFFSLAPEVIAGLLIAIVVESRVLGGDSGLPSGTATLIAVTIIAFTVGAAASLSAVAADDGTLPSVFGLTTQAIALGFLAILALIVVLKPAQETDAAPP